MQMALARQWRPWGDTCWAQAPTFMRKKVMLVSRSTVDLRSCRRSGLLAGKLFCGGTGVKAED